ncbi:MAG: hypothetical protein DRM99_03645 [Thermoplasmata archaeon]|nr:MAG: hypothetical protein DRM99_03645 [Thermoplasmata archaeon]
MIFIDVKKNLCEMVFMPKLKHDGNKILSRVFMVGHSYKTIIPKALGMLLGLKDRDTIEWDVIKSDASGCVLIVKKYEENEVDQDDGSRANTDL